MCIIPCFHTELVKQYVDGIFTVTDDEIALAILTLLEQQKLISEGAGAVPVAAVLAGKIPDIEGKNVCCLVSHRVHLKLIHIP